LAFPLKSRHFELHYQPAAGGLHVDFEGSNGEDFKLLFYGVIENAHSQLKNAPPIEGHFKIISSLPVGTGLGASAALCGAVARWCESQNWIKQDGIYEFARCLEDLFHGESSGVDLAVSLSGEGVRFVRNGSIEPIQVAWRPKLYLSYCGQRGMTSDCVTKVKRLFETDAARAKSLDAQMLRAVEMALSALMTSEEAGLHQLKESLELAGACFEEWGLCVNELTHHLHWLKSHGALAVKPTGSGGGGYVLSLWDHEPPVSLQPLLVPAFC
jgi:mevalonate kinase